MIAFVWISSFNLDNPISVTEVATDLEVTTHYRQDNCSPLPKIKSEVA